MTPLWMEPHKVTMVDRIPFPTREQREECLRAAEFNLFRVPASAVTIDLLTDSGTNAMSNEQWSAMFRGDESYAHSRSYERFYRSVADLTGCSEVLPTHQGRAAESIVLSELVESETTVVSNGLFDTTAANVLRAGGHPLDLTVTATTDTDFGGDLDVDAAQTVLAAPDRTVSAVVITITNNAAGGLPVSVENLRAARKICDDHNVPLWLDASRYAENAYLVRQRDTERADAAPRRIAREMFDLADGCWISMKKDGFGNIGGLIALRDADLAQRCRTSLIATEGFPTYGGLAGRDLEALATGIDEALELSYLQYRVDSMAWFGQCLAACGVPIVRPVGGHAVFIDAAALLPHIPAHEFPGHAFAVEMYRAGGVRSCEIGTLMFGQPQSDGAPDTSADRELVRLAVPRRVYSSNQLMHVVETAASVVERAASLRGYRILEQPAHLRHFTARMEPLG